jgi:hypothetical protein
MIDQFEVWCIAATNSCVTFVGKIDGITAETPEAAGIEGITSALKFGLNMTPSLGMPAVKVPVLSCIPFRIEKVTQVVLAQAMPQKKGQS